MSKSDKNSDLISIIIPVYNVGKYLDRCMNSVLNQTYTNIEVILVDDGSKDNSGKMCDEYARKDNRVKVIHKKNGGLSSARNAALEICRGEYFGFVDSDDWISLDYYENLLGVVGTYNVDVAFSDFEFVEDKDYSKTKYYKVTESDVIIREEDILDRYFYRMRGEKSSYGAWEGLYSKRVLGDIRFIEGEINEDVLYRYRVLGKVRRVAFLKHAMYKYYKNNNGITNRQLNIKDISLLKIWDIVVEEEKGKKNEQMAILNRKRAIFTLYSKFVLNGNEDVPEELLKTWKNELKCNKNVLLSNHILDWKRKLLLIYIILK